MEIRLNFFHISKKFVYYKRRKRTVTTITTLTDDWILFIVFLIFVSFLNYPLLTKYSAFNQQGVVFFLRKM